MPCPNFFLAVTFSFPVPGRVVKSYLSPKTPEDAEKSLRGHIVDSTCKAEVPELGLHQVFHALWTDTIFQLFEHDAHH